jgi:hypothetical protein
MIAVSFRHSKDAYMSPTNDENRKCVVRFLAQVIVSARHDADHVAAFLGSVRLKPRKNKPVQLPAEFLLELAAILRLARWEQTGIHHLINRSLPSAREALRHLAIRAKEAPDSFCLDVKLPPNDFAHQVFALWLMRCARSSVEELGVDVVISGADRKRVLDALADLIWKNRQLGMN